MGVGWSCFLVKQSFGCSTISGAAVAQMTLLYSPTWESVIGEFGILLVGVMTLTL